MCVQHPFFKFLYNFLTHCIATYTCIYIQIYVCIYTCVYIFVYVHACICVRVNIYCICTYMCMHVQMYTCECTWLIRTFLTLKSIWGKLPILEWISHILFLPEILSQIIYIKYLVRILKPMQNNWVIKSWYARSAHTDADSLRRPMPWFLWLPDGKINTRRLVLRKSLGETGLIDSHFQNQCFPITEAGKYIHIKGLGMDICHLKTNTCIVDRHSPRPALCLSTVLSSTLEICQLLAPWWPKLRAPFVFLSASSPRPYT